MNAESPKEISVRLRRARNHAAGKEWLRLESAYPGNVLSHIALMVDEPRVAEEVVYLLNLCAYGSLWLHSLTPRTKRLREVGTALAHVLGTSFGHPILRPLLYLRLAQVDERLDNLDDANNWYRKVEEATQNHRSDVNLTILRIFFARWHLRQGRYWLANHTVRALKLPYFPKADLRPFVSAARLVQWEAYRQSEYRRWWRTARNAVLIGANNLLTGDDWDGVGSVPLAPSQAASLWLPYIEPIR